MKFSSTVFISALSGAGARKLGQEQGQGQGNKLRGNSEIAEALVDLNPKRGDGSGFTINDITSDSYPSAGKGQGQGQGQVQGNKLKFVGVNDKDGYGKLARAFVGLNPIRGDGSGFIIGDITSDSYPSENPASRGGRNNLCTCDCVAGDDGVGCVGWGGIAFKYSSALWLDPKGSGAWEGQIQAYQQTPTNELNFMGSDIRSYPGGEVVYNVACTDKECGGALSGTFRQSNKPVSCEAGLADKQLADGTTCWVRCANAGTYMDWIDYCEADEEDKDLGFSGYGR